MSIPNPSSSNKAPIALRLQKIKLRGRFRRSPILKNISQFEFIDDVPRPTCPMGFARERHFRSQIGEASIAALYSPDLTRASCHFVVKDDDRLGINPAEIASLLAELKEYWVTGAWFVLDFARQCKVNETFVRKFGIVGKSCNIRNERPGVLLFVTPTIGRWVRCYSNGTSGSFRIEVEIDASFVQDDRLMDIQDVIDLGSKLSPAHIRFAEISPKPLRALAIRGFGRREGPILLQEALELSESSLELATQFLSRDGLPPPFGFYFNPLAINEDIKVATKLWSDQFLDQFDF